MSGDEIGAFYTAWWFVRRRRGRTGIDITPSTRPTMPKRAWRVRALACFAVGAVVAALSSALLDPSAGGTVALRAGAGGLVAVGIGMIVLETRWERRHPELFPPRATVGAAPDPD